MTDKSSSGPDGVSPWSGEVPIPNAPAEFTWATIDDAPGPPPGSSGSASDGPPALHGVGGGAVDVSATAGDRERRSRQRSLVVAGIGAVLLLTVGWLAFGRGDDAAEPDTAAVDSLPAETNVEDSLPFVVEEPADTEPEDPDGAGGAGGAAAGDGAEVAEWRDDTVELPPALLASSVPFDIVAVTSDGDYIEVEIPSGRVHALEIGRGIDGRVVAGETSTLVVSYSSTQGGRLLRPGEPPLELSLPSNMDITQVGAAGDEFAGLAYGNNGEQSLVRVTADGGVVTTTTDDAEFNFWQRRFTPDGSALVSEAGGVYREGTDGFERISTGFLISASTNHVLVRECDSAMVCGYSTIDFETGERTEAKIVDDTFGSFGFDSAQVSPDGRWLRYISYSNDSSDEVLIDLTTGERTELDFANLGTASRVWAADSSGFFRTSLQEGFEFYDVASGAAVAFGAQFGRMVSFDVRTVSGGTAPPLRASTTTGVALVALTETGDIAQIDVDSGAVVTTDGPGMGSTAPVTIFPDAAGATITSYDNVPSVRFIAAERTALVADGPGPGGPLWPGPVPGTVWQTGDGTDSDMLALELVDAQGNDLGARIEFDAIGLNGIIGSDGRGGVVIGPQLGGVFALDGTNPPERVTNGELLAINAAVAYVRECDDSLQCGVFTVDRASGTRTLADNTGLTRAGDIADRGVPPGQNVSPDGTIAFVRDGADPTRCLMIDTTASRGAWTGVPCVDLASPIIWTPDSGYALWLDEGSVTVYERATRSVRTVNTVPLSAIAAVPNDAAPIVVPVAVEESDDETVS